MAGTLRKSAPAQLIVEAKEFVWRQKLGGYSVREIAPMVSEHLGRPIAKSTVHRWIDTMTKDSIARTESNVDLSRAIELEKLDEMERRVQQVMDATHYALSGGEVVRGPAEGEEAGDPLLDDEPVIRSVVAKLRIMERRAKLRGLDSPTQFVGDVEMVYRIVGVDPAGLR